jgi:hypothetical protein
MKNTTENNKSQQSRPSYRTKRSEERYLPKPWKLKGCGDTPQEISPYVEMTVSILHNKTQQLKNGGRSRGLFLQGQYKLSVFP